MSDLLIVFIVICVLILAFMASQLDIDITPQTGSTLPKIQIKFRKDSSLFSFLRPGVPTNNEEIIVDEPYINKFIVGEATIVYGDTSASTLNYDIQLKAIEDGMDKYYYFNGDVSTKFKRIEGFTAKDSDFKSLNKFESWDGTIGSGPFFNLHRITLPLKRLSIGKVIKLKYNLEIFPHYRELSPGIDVTYHAIFFRCLNTTENSIFKFNIPNGKESVITRFDLISEFNNRMVLNHELEVREGLFSLPKDFGLVSIIINENFTTIQWSIPRKSLQGTIYKLKWYTEA